MGGSSGSVDKEQKQTRWSRSSSFAFTLTRKKKKGEVCTVLHSASFRARDKQQQAEQEAEQQAEQQEEQQHENPQDGSGSTRSHWDKLKSKTTQVNVLAKMKSAKDIYDTQWYQSIFEGEIELRKSKGLGSPTLNRFSSLGEPPNDATITRGLDMFEMIQLHPAMCEP